MSILHSNLQESECWTNIHGPSWKFRASTNATYKAIMFIICPDSHPGLQGELQWTCFLTHLQPRLEKPILHLFQWKMLAEFWTLSNFIYMEMWIKFLYFVLIMYSAYQLHIGLSFIVIIHCLTMPFHSQMSIFASYPVPGLLQLFAALHSLVLYSLVSLEAF